LRLKKTGGVRSGLNPDAWMITFSDLLTLMLTFFVLLLTMSSMDNKRLRETFGFFAGTQGGMEREGKGGSSGVPASYDIRYPSLHVLPPGALQAEAFPEMRLAWGKGSHTGDPFKKGKSQNIETAFEEGLRGLGLRKGVEVKREDGGVVVCLSEDILFELGRARIGFEGMMVLEKCGEVLAKIPNRVRIRGHTDDLPIAGGKYKTNWELSTARAVNVLRFLTESLGLDSRRFSAVGYGMYRPLVPNTGPENRAKNRRAEILVLPNTKGIRTEG
jgi:chemotaxis protein MotB